MKAVSTLVLVLGLAAGLVFTSCTDSKSEKSTENPPAENKQNSEPTEPEPVNSEPTEEISEREDVLSITGDNVNVRSKASPNSKVLFQLHSGDKVDFSKESGFAETINKLTDVWYKVSQEGKEGWVFGAFTNRKLSENTRTDDMIFLYSEMGDYYHLVFQWADEATANGHGWKCPRYGMEADGSWDFGYGSQHGELSDYELEREEDGVSNPEYENKVFEVEWRVQMTNAWEGEGSMETVEMQVPVIAGLKLKE